MHTIKNLVNSPYDIRLADGKTARLPARGELENIEIDPMHLPLYRTLGYFVLTEVQAKPGKTSVVDEEKAALDKLRAEYLELTGKKPFGGWKAEEIQKRIDKALEA